MFKELLDNIKTDTIRYLSHIELASEDDMRRMEQQRRDEQKNREFKHAQASGLDQAEDQPEGARQPVLRQGPKVGRNDPCPCGSGKKFKQCCGKI
jgi:preprotein translocase subunit SecA